MFVVGKASSNGQISKLQPLVNGVDRDSGSTNNTPSHSRNNSSTSLNTSINSSTGTESLQKSVGDLFNGFVIAVHRKMVSSSDETIIDYNRIIVARGVTSATIDSSAEKSISLYLLPVYLPIPILGYFLIEFEVISFVFHQLFNIQSYHTNIDKRPRWPQIAHLVSEAPS